MTGEICDNPADDHSPPDSARRRRHRRPSVSRRGAGRRADEARHAGASGYGFPGAALQRLVHQRHDRRGAERNPARPLAVVAGAHRRDAGRRHRGGSQSDAPVEAQGGGRLRRLPDAAAAARRAAVRHSRGDSRFQCGAGPRQPFSLRPRQRHCDLAAGRARSGYRRWRRRRPRRARRCVRRSSPPPQ